MLQLQSPRSLSRSLATLLGALAVSQAPSAIAQSAPVAPNGDDPAYVTSLIKDLGIRESDTEVRTRKDWRQPKKIVLLGGDSGTRAQRDAFQALVPKAEIVVVTSVPKRRRPPRMRTSSSASTSYPGVCEPEIIDVSKDLRWILSMSRGRRALHRYPERNESQPAA